MDIQKVGISALAVKYEIGNCSTEKKNELLRKIAEFLQLFKEDILVANEKDIQIGKKNGLSTALLDRLRITDERLNDMVTGIEQVISLPDPCAIEPITHELNNGLLCERKNVPFGTILMIYEARPNVTIDAAVLGLKTGNALILRGGKEAIHSNKALVTCIHKALTTMGLPEETVQLITDPDRSLVGKLIRMRDYIDLVIPRGGAGLIKYIVENSLVPVIETGSGICHIYIDESADLNIVTPIVINAKVQRPSVCNALETLLIDKDIAEAILPQIAKELVESGVEIRGDEETCALVTGAIPATEEDWSTEYNDMILAIRIVDGLAEALQHIRKYGTKHSECVIAEDRDVVDCFMREVDAAAVYANASTRFTDGFEFGLGAEIGISTQKMHVRGPMGLEALVTYKYRLYGNGQIRS